MRTASGKIATISNSRRAVYGYDQRIEAFGEKGMLQAMNNTDTNLLFSGQSGIVADPPQYFFLERYADAYRLELTLSKHCKKNETRLLLITMVSRRCNWRRLQTLHLPVARQSL